MPAIEITEELCIQFRKYLLDRFNGDTPTNYFSSFKKKVMKAATKQGYFRINPVEDLAAKGNRNKARKDHLESAEYIRLLETPCLNSEVKAAFNVNTATVALFPGHTTSKYVNDIYRRYRPKDQSQVISQFPGLDILSYFLGFSF